MKYRADIDGLRAVAVMPVVLYHVGAGPFTGGFVGVDVFFVISGFLITSLIVEDIRNDRFSLLDFYERRARRILPPLFAVMAASAVAAYLLFLPPPLLGFSESLIATSFFGSNFYFWWQVDYFDAPAELKPLLHTWSLAVEEQFYLLYPLLLLLVVRRWKNAWPVVIMMLMVVSYLASIWAVRRMPAAAFYLLPYRAWELLLGAMLASGFAPKVGGRRLAEVLSLAGVALIAYAVFTYRTSMVFPGRAAVYPCLGAALLIYAGGLSTETLVGRAMTWRPVVFIGLISYSLYLWHWPIVVFGKYWLVMPPTPTILAGMVLASVVLSYLSWKWLEGPIRAKLRLPTRRELAAGIGACVAAFLVFGMWGIAAQGWPHRISPVVLALADEKQFMHDRRDCNGVSNKQLSDLCIRGASGVAPDFILVGDSHADALSPGLFAAAAAAGRAGYQFTEGGYRPAYGFDRVGDEMRIRKLDANLRELIERSGIRDIFIMAYWSSAMKNEYLDANGHRRSAALVLAHSLTTLARSDPNIRLFVIEDNPSAPQLSPGTAARPFISESSRRSASRGRNTRSNSMPSVRFSEKSRSFRTSR